MATTFRYRAVTRDGVRTSGVVQAPDEYAAVMKIREKCPVVEDIKPVKESANADAWYNKSIGSSKVQEKSLSILCSQFAIMLRSGQMLGRSLTMVSNQTADKALKKILLEVADDVDQGSSMAASFERHGGKQLPITFIETIRAGELSGTLDRSFATLKDYYEKSYKNAEKIKSAMTYPIFVVLVAIVVLIVVMAKVIPALAGTFSSLGGDLPLITQIMIDASNFFAKWYILMLLVVLALVVAYKLYAGTQQGRLVIGKIMLNMPVLGPINVFHGAAQFADTMSAMLQSGLTVNRAVEVTAKVMDNAILQEDVSSMIPKIEEGRSLGDCIRATKDFPDNLKEMCAIGEESGSLDATLTTIADYYHNEEDHATTQAIAKMEPTMMVFLAVFAGFIVISIYLPMFTMYNLM